MGAKGNLEPSSGHSGGVTCPTLQCVLPNLELAGRVSQGPEETAVGLANKGKMTEILQD